jgi:predicted DNA-binding protein with PD1-like motif
VLLLKVLAVKVPKGRDPHEFLRQKARELGVKNALIIGIGGFRKAEIGVFRGDGYDTLIIESKPPHILEVANLTGNLIDLGDDISTHIHVTLGRSHSELFAGHLIKAEVDPFLELFLIESSSDLKEVFDHRLMKK